MAPNNIGPQLTLIKQLNMHALGRFEAILTILCHNVFLSLLQRLKLLPLLDTFCVHRQPMKMFDNNTMRQLNNISINRHIKETTQAYCKTLNFRGHLSSRFCDVNYFTAF